VYRAQHYGRYKAINAAELALETDKECQSTDKWSMWETAKDMNNKYKETRERFSIAVNMIVKRIFYFYFQNSISSFMVWACHYFALVASGSALASREKRELKQSLHPSRNSFALA
jgi:hypothetical protein